MAISLQLSPTLAPIPYPGPLSALQTIAQSTDYDYLLLHSGPAQGFSVLAFDPLCTLSIDARGIPSLTCAQAMPPLTLLPTSAAPLRILEHLINTIDFSAPHPLIGWLGFLSYDIARFLETIPPHAPDDLHWPLLRFSLFKHYLLFDTTSNTSIAYTLGDSPALEWPHPVSPPVEIPPAKLLTRQSPADFQSKVRRVKDYIAAGDIYQANLAQRWTLQTSAQPHDIFRRLCDISPAPYAVCMRFRDAQTMRHVVSASPELFLTLQNNHLLTRPIKGTRPRDLANPARDLELRTQLLNSAKDHAELTMIVDLLRNDLGRISRYGTVHVTEPRALEQHPTVWHTVATIESDLRPDASLSDILAALCPGGSITGAPKIRAMQIIEELEGGVGGFRRALYCGNLGVIGPRATSLAFNIAIRTLLFQNDHAYLYAGAGIVADSDPAHEHEETLHKAAALFRALGLEMSPK